MAEELTFHKIKPSGGAAVKTEVAAQVVEKALENNITVDGLEAFMTEGLDGVL